MMPLLLSFACQPRNSDPLICTESMLQLHFCNYITVRWRVGSPPVKRDPFATLVSLVSYPKSTNARPTILWLI
uniref:Uncharacterized protein n=1 Tax=Rhizophora mucronata TaxID=61149 RepID=A0A2P2J0E2_RHIMU